MAENFLKLIKNFKVQIQEIQQAPGKINEKKTIPSPIIVKVLKTNSAQSVPKKGEIRQEEKEEAAKCYWESFLVQLRYNSNKPHPPKKSQVK